MRKSCGSGVGKEDTEGRYRRKIQKKDTEERYRRKIQKEDTEGDFYSDSNDADDEIAYTFPIPDARHPAFRRMFRLCRVTAPLDVPFPSLALSVARSSIHHVQFTLSDEEQAEFRARPVEQSTPGETTTI